ncbi:inositol monophosphatase family protein [Bacillus testis]|uniref:inositol monophosphatase family protein n=1 Tax=Bacillus testis TaxID=1622072 RepID=UPI00067F00D4|nr:inositol monophosphatase family protein [Bacillus testis]
MDEKYWEKLKSYAMAWMKEAGQQIKQSFGQVLHIETKSDRTDLVTDIDKEIEVFLRDKVTAAFPNHKIVAEEGMGEQVENLDGIVWFIDPIDGTSNFIHQQRNFAISIGIYDDGVGIIGLIYDVVHDEMYHARRGAGAYMNDTRLLPLEPATLENSMIALNASWLLPKKTISMNAVIRLVRGARATRSFGSAAIELASAAAGRIDAYMSMRLAPWDFAAGAVLIEEVGGVISDIKGNQVDFLKGGTFLVAKPGLHEEIVTALFGD